VDSYITLTEFARQKFITGGLPADKLHVKANFLSSDPGVASTLGTGAVYIGRLSPEKGVQVVLDAWQQLEDEPLTIVGDGPDRVALEAYARQHVPSQVRFLGHLNVEACLDLIKQARVVIMPSLWYETFGRVIIEAYGCGKPVIASRLGAMAELIQDNTTGLLFTPGDANDLATKLYQLLSSPERCQRMGVAARQVFEREFTAAENYSRLIRIYEGTISGYRG
jgi:glycosyltransferase involved in cell wall biosynthesis